MERAILKYIGYIHDEKRVSYNTEISYERDIKNAIQFFKQHDIDTPDKVTETNVNSYMLWLERENLSAATISRRIAALRSFFDYLKMIGEADSNPAQDVKPPRVEKRMPSFMTSEDMERLLEQPDRQSVKGIRDKAMLELLCSTGIRVSELINLKLDELDLKRGYIVCRTSANERWIGFSDPAAAAIDLYLKYARAIILGEKENPYLFVNYQGDQMSRQGFWKLLKKYAKKADIAADITPHTLRQTFIMKRLIKG